MAHFCTSKSGFQQALDKLFNGSLFDNSAAKPILLSPVVALFTISVLLASVVVVKSWLNTELAIEYTIPPPKKVQATKDWDEPAIKLPGSTAIHCYAPATGEFLGLVNPSSPAGIDRAIEQAQVAQTIWAKTTFSQRRQVLRTLLAFVLKNQEDICRVACLDSGKTMIDASLGEILVTAEKLRWTILHGERALRPSRRPTNLLMLYKNNQVFFEPLGVVAALVSWNYPFHNLIGPIISAIFAGNAIVVKASENTAWSASYFTSIVKGALAVCGHDPSLVQSVVCWPSVANHLTSHNGISHITFIGSRTVAHKVASSAAKALIPVVAELGGKDAVVILDSAASDLPRIKEIMMRGTFQSAGQNCIGIERIIACPAVYKSLVGMLEPSIRKIRVGSGLDSKGSYQIDTGAMISAASFDRLEGLIRNAVKSGARLLVGGERLQHEEFPKGHYFQPTLLVDVTAEMDIAKEECFAPICVVMKANSTAHAVEIANGPNFGLGASAFGAEGPELDEVVRCLRSGMVTSNDWASYYAVQLPFGGVGGSGYGRFAGEEGLRGLCNIKAVCKDRWGWLGVKTAIPRGMRYPIPDTGRGFQFCMGIIEVGYEPGLWGKIQGIKKLATNG